MQNVHKLPITAVRIPFASKRSRSQTLLAYAEATYITLVLSRIIVFVLVLVPFIELVAPTFTFLSAISFPAILTHLRI
jgi:hypothetical protein